MPGTAQPRIHPLRPKRAQLDRLDLDVQPVMRRDAFDSNGGLGLIPLAAQVRPLRCIAVFLQRVVKEILTAGGQTAGLDLMPLRQQVAVVRLIQERGQLGLVPQRESTQQIDHAVGVAGDEVDGPLLQRRDAAPRPAPTSPGPHGGTRSASRPTAAPGIACAARRPNAAAPRNPPPTPGATGPDPPACMPMPRARIARPSSFSAGLSR